VAIYLMVMRLGRGRAAALIATALWPLARAPLQALANANLTNLFGQSLFAVALAGAACLAGGSSAGAVGLAAIAAFLVAAFLSHFGTVTVGVAMFGAAGVALLLVGRGFARRAGAWMMAVLLLAASVSWVAYYSHFTDVYARTWADVSARGSDDSSKLVASPSVKLGRWWAGTGDDYGRPGVPVLLAAVAGAALVVRRQRRTGAGLVLLAWVLAWVALSVLGILTPFTLRANLAVAPALVALCGVALGSLADHSRAGAVAAAVLALVLAWDGGSVAIWAITLAGR
jgi:hypothetical protein